ncbi:MAG: hypothetical protein ACEPOZ_05925 [Marinifilaceae bacterium]
MAGYKNNNNDSFGGDTQEKDSALMLQRPYRSPHHTISDVAKII